MKHVRALSDVGPEDRGASAAIGNFDGVHLGHQAVLARARDHAAPGKLAVVTFEPHPREVFVPDGPPFRLMNAEAKRHRLEKLGVDILFELPFGPELHRLSADGFCRDVLAGGLGLSHATVGADFRFGKGRTGTAEGLEAAGDALGFGVSIADLVSPLPGAPRISSPAIREALSDGRPEEAARMLGHWHRIEGPVEHGDKRGRLLGYPTANMGLDGLHLPRFGVYAVLVDVLSGPHAGTWRGAASLGVRPMFGENRPNLETFLFDFDGDLYGTHLSVALVAFLRPERRFDGVEALVAQMEADCTQARAALERAE
jgi:riboflavin kinase/FMN adenylyltransferase